MVRIPWPACARMSRYLVRCPATRPTEQVREQLDQSDQCDVTQSLAHATSHTSTCVGLGSLHSLDDTTLCQRSTDRRPFNDLLPRTTWVSRHQKGKPFWILIKPEKMEWQRHQLDDMGRAVAKALQPRNHKLKKLLPFIHRLWHGVGLNVDQQSTAKLLTCVRITVHNYRIQYSSDNLSFYPDNQHCSDGVYWKRAIHDNTVEAQR